MTADLMGLALALALGGALVTLLVRAWRAAGASDAAPPPPESAPDPALFAAHAEIAHLRQRLTRLEQERAELAVELRASRRTNVQLVAEARKLIGERVTAATGTYEDPPTIGAADREAAERHREAQRHQRLAVPVRDPAIPEGVAFVADDPEEDPE